MKRLSVWLSEEQETAIIELSGGVGAKRSEWVRQAIDAAIDTARHLDRITIVPAGDTAGSPVASPCAGDVAGLQAEISRLTEQILEERAQRIADLKSSADKLIEQGERYQVLLQGAQQATLTERAGTGRRPWWKIWGK